MKLRLTRSSLSTSGQTCYSPAAGRQGLRPVMHARCLGKPKGVTEARFWAVLGSTGRAAASALRENEVTQSLTFGTPDLQKTFPATCLFYHDMQQRTQYGNTNSQTTSCIKITAVFASSPAGQPFFPTYTVINVTSWLVSYWDTLAQRRQTCARPVPKPKATARPQPEENSKYLVNRC